MYLQTDSGWKMQRTGRTIIKLKHSLINNFYIIQLHEAIPSYGKVTLFTYATL